MGIGPGQDDEIVVGLRVEFTEFNRRMDDAETRVGRLEGKSADLTQSMNRIGVQAAAAGAAIVALAGVAVAQASAFEREIANVSTLVDTSIVSMDQLQEEVLELDSELGGAIENTQALYQAISAGAEPAKAVKLVADAAKLARAGLTSTEVAVDALTSVLNAYQLEADQATEISDIFFKTVEQGKTTVDQLAGAIGQIVPIASQAGVQFEEVGAALATLTKSGLSTDLAATQLKNLIASLIDPTDQAREAFEQLNIDISVSRIESEGLIPILQEVREATGGSADEVARLFPNMRALSAAATLAGGGFDEFNRILGETSNAAGATEDALAKQAETLSFQLAALRAEAQKVAIIFGDDLVPVVKSAVSVLQSFLSVLKEIPEPIRKVIVIGGAGSGAALGLAGTMTLIAGQVSFAIQSLQQLRGALTSVNTALTTTTTAAATAKTAGIDPISSALGVTATAAPQAAAGISATGTAASGAGASFAAALGPVLAVIAALAAGIGIGRGLAKIFPVLDDLVDTTAESMEQLNEQLAAQVAEGRGVIESLDAQDKAFVSAADSALKYKRRLNEVLSEQETFFQKGLGFIEAWANAWRGNTDIVNDALEGLGIGRIDLTNRLTEEQINQLSILSQVVDEAGNEYEDFNDALSASDKELKRIIKSQQEAVQKAFDLGTLTDQIQIMDVAIQRLGELVDAEADTIDQRLDQIGLFLEEEELLHAEQLERMKAQRIIHGQDLEIVDSIDTFKRIELQELASRERIKIIEEELAKRRDLVSQATEDEAVFSENATMEQLRVVEEANERILELEQELAEEVLELGNIRLERAKANNEELIKLAEARSEAERAAAQSIIDTQQQAIAELETAMERVKALTGEDVEAEEAEGAFLKSIFGDESQREDVFEASTRIRQAMEEIAKLQDPAKERQQLEELLSVRNDLLEQIQAEQEAGEDTTNQQSALFSLFNEGFKRLSELREEEIGQAKNEVDEKIRNLDLILEKRQEFENEINLLLEDRLEIEQSFLERSFEQNVNHLDNLIAAYREAQAQVQGFFGPEGLAVEGPPGGGGDVTVNNFNEVLGGGDIAEATTNSLIPALQTSQELTGEGDSERGERP